MGLLELLLIVLVIAAIAGGIGVSPLLWLLLLVALVRLPHGRRIRLSQRREGLGWLSAHRSSSSPSARSSATA